MQRVLAVAWLTLKAAFRFRLVLVLAVILLGGVILLPLMIKDDGTAQGFTQIVLTYTLMLITTLLGFATLWLACGTLARDIEECQMQMLAVKPIGRWQIWLGKLLGIVTLNALLLGLSAGAVFFLMQWRAQQLPPEEQAVLHNEVLIARGSAREAMPDIEPAVDRLLRERLLESEVQVSDVEFVRNQIREQVKAQFQIVPPGYLKRWDIDLGFGAEQLRDQPFFLRFKFNVAELNPSGTYYGRFVVGDFESPTAYRTDLKSLAADTFHEIEVPPGQYDQDGNLIVSFINDSGTVLLFTLEDGLEVLYREGGFVLNFIRGVLIIFFWLTFLATIGLAAASFLSFPVATFFSLAILLIGLSSGTIEQVIAQGTILEVNHETGLADEPAWIDFIALPAFRALLKVINLVEGFSPIDSLSSGRSITWGQLGLAFFQVCVVLGGFFTAIGIYTFTRRELATAQSNQ